MEIENEKLTPENMIRQLALYLLCWGEANQVRFAPECLCFIFKCALDYDISTSSSEKTVKSPEYSYLNDVITPLYEFLRGQVYKKDAKGTGNEEKKTTRILLVTTTSINYFGTRKDLNVLF